MGKPLPILTVIALLAGVVPTRAFGDPGGAQGEMRAAIRSRSVLSPNQVERRIVPSMPGMQYLGPEYYPEAMAYRLKFIRNGRVVFIDVDARTGRVISEHR